MPDAFISITTSWASGVGSENCISSSPRSPVNTTPRIVSSPCFCWRSDLGRKNMVGKGRTWSDLARPIVGSSVTGLPRPQLMHRQYLRPIRDVAHMVRLRLLIDRLQCYKGPDSGSVIMNTHRYLKPRKIFLAAALMLMCQPAWAEKRVALVLGNSAYQNVEQLPNPVSDGAIIAAKLKEAGFDVVDSRHDLPAAETRRALRDFADRSRDADIAVVYYAGHGMEVDGTNYLIPVDAKLERDTDVYDEAFSLDRVLLAIEPAKRLRLVILDACRDNPFSKSMKRTLASRALGQGLAKIEPSSPNMLIAYSAKAGSTAADGDSSNSPFTIALSKHLTTPGLDVRRAFGFVRDDVLKTTSYRQEPFVYGSLGGEDVPLVPVPATAPPATPQADIRRDYELAQQIGNKAALNAFVAQYPDGFYAELARSQLAKIAAEETRVAATEKA